MQNDKAAQERYAEALKTAIAFLSGRAEALKGNTLTSPYSGVYLAVIKAEQRLAVAKQHSEKVSASRKLLETQLDSVTSLNANLRVTIHDAQKQLEVSVVGLRHV